MPVDKQRQVTTFQKVQESIVLPQDCSTPEIYPGSTLYGEKVYGQLPCYLSERFHGENLQLRWQLRFSVVSSVCLVTAAKGRLQPDSFGGFILWQAFMWIPRWEPTFQKVKSRPRSHMCRSLTECLMYP